MSKATGFDIFLLYMNWLLCVLQLGLYAWGDHAPKNLALGIFSGLVALFVAISIIGRS